MKKYRRSYLFITSLVIVSGMALFRAVELLERPSYVQTIGIVEAVAYEESPLTGEKIGIRSVTVSYLADDESFTVARNQSASVGQYSLAQAVSVYYDATNPERAVVAPIDQNVGQRAALMTLSSLGLGYVLVERARPTSKNRL